MAYLLAAERVQTGSYISLDYIIGDTGISQGRYVQLRRSMNSEMSLSVRKKCKMDTLAMKNH